jgi:hypothetical protein
VNGTGTLLANLVLPITPSDCPSEYDAAYCPFFLIGVTFAGRAESVSLGGTTDQIVFDDLTFGRSTPGTPEPASLLLVTSGLVGIAAKLRRQHQS